MLVLSGKTGDRFFVGDHPVQIVSVCRRTGKVRKRKLAEAQDLDELADVTRQAF